MTEFWFGIGCVLPAFLVSVLVTRAMITFAPRCGLIDQPAARKVHSVPTPLGGGVGIVCGVIVPLSLAYPLVWLLGRADWGAEWMPEVLRLHLDGVLYRAPQLWAILSAGVLLAVMGLLDDVRPISWRIRLLLQLLISLGVVAAGVRITLFLGSPWLGGLLTVLWLVFLINSLNFLDNMDGLTSGISLIAALFFAGIMLTQTSEPRWLVAGMLLVVAGACAGFLVWNWTPARIFMGDSGSTFLGLMLGCLTVLGTYYDASSHDTHVILAPLCVLAVPLYDFLSVLLIRLKRGLSPFQPDKNHFSHRLVDLGLTRKNAVLTIYLCTILTGLAGLLLYRLPGWGSAWTILAMVGCVLWVIAILETAGRRVSVERARLAEQLTPREPASAASTSVAGNSTPASASGESAVSTKPAEGN